MASNQYPPLPKVGPIGFASVVDVQAYAPWLKIGPHLPGVRDVALWTTDQMRAYLDADRAARGVMTATAPSNPKPMAWLVFQPPGSEYDYKVYANEVEAETDAASQDETEAVPRPLFFAHGVPEVDRG